MATSTHSSQISSNASDSTDPSTRSNSLIRRSWRAMADRLSPFSPAALASLPPVSRPLRYTRADAIPSVEDDENGQRPTIPNYLSINNLPSQVKIPKKLATPVRVEGKVWFANERTWVSWLNLAVLLGALSLALFNASKDAIARNFAYTYAAISICVLVYGYVLYQHRITMIRRRDPGHFDAVAGPVIVSVLLFFAILANFIIRVRELRDKNIPIPGSDFIPSMTWILSVIPGFRDTTVDFTSRFSAGLRNNGSTSLF